MATGWRRAAAAAAAALLAFYVAFAYQSAQLVLL